MIFCSDLDHPECPVRMPDGSWLIVQMNMGEGEVSQISADGAQIKTIRKTGRPNGIAKDDRGNIWVAETLDPSLIKISPDGSARTISRGNAHQLFLWPNDLVVGPDGAIYMTDSGVHVSELMTPNGPDPEVWRTTMNGCLYRIDPQTEQVECLDSGFQFANGLAFGPDGRLYVAETVTGNIYRYDFTDRLEINSRVLFVTVTDQSGPRRVAGPDGIAFDEEGNLYAAIFGQGHVAMVEPSGAIRRHLVTRGSCPTNLAFGPKGSKQIYITEYQRGQIEVLAVQSDGFNA